MRKKLILLFLAINFFTAWAVPWREYTIVGLGNPWYDVSSSGATAYGCDLSSIYLCEITIAL